MNREERVALGVLLLALVGYVLTGCEPSSSTATWDAGLETLELARALRVEPPCGCPASTYPEAPEEVRGRCSPDLAACLQSLGDEGDCYYAQAGECAECVEHEARACATERGGCAEAYGAIACCRASECPTGDGVCLQRALLPGGECHAAVTQFEDCVRASTRDGPCEAVPPACVAAP
jgi:hypothetical protein